MLFPNLHTHSPAVRSASLKCNFAVGVLDGMRMLDFDIDAAYLHVREKTPIQACLLSRTQVLPNTRASFAVARGEITHCISVGGEQTNFNIPEV